MRTEWVEPMLKRLSMKDLDDLYAALGYGGILLSQVIPKLREQYKNVEKQKNNEDKDQEITEIVSKPKDHEERARRQKSTQGVIVKGIDNVPIRFGRCCNPVPGDDIIGYVTRGRGVTIHRSDCTNFEKTDDSKNRFIEVQWDQEKPTTYATEVQIIAPDRKGLLSEVTQLITDTAMMVTGVNAKLTKNEIAVINLTVEVSNQDELNKLISKIKNMSGVIDVKRIIS